MYQLESDIVGHIKTYFNTVNTGSQLISHKAQLFECIPAQLMRGCSVYNLIKYQECDRVLLVPSFKDSVYTEFAITRNGNKIYPANSMPQMLMPIIAKEFGLDIEVTVAYPSAHVGIYKYLYQQYGIDIVTCNEFYELGSDTWTCAVPTNLCDYVLLAQIPKTTEDGQFASSDLKDDFAGLCESTFRLEDAYVDTATRVDMIADDRTTQYGAVGRITGTRFDQSAFAAWVVPHAVPDGMKIGGGTQASVELQLSHLQKDLTTHLRVY